MKEAVKTIYPQAYDVASALPLDKAAFGNHYQAVFHSWCALQPDRRRIALRDGYVFVAVAQTIKQELQRKYGDEIERKKRSQRQIMLDGFGGQEIDIAIIRDLVEHIAALGEEDGPRPEEWFRGLDFLVEGLVAAKYAGEARLLVSIARNTDVEKFPRYAQPIGMNEAYLDAMAGEAEKAAQTATKIVSQPYLLPDRRALPKVYRKLLFILSAGNNIPEYRRVLWKAAMGIHATRRMHRLFAAQIVCTYRGAWRAFLRCEVPFRYRLVFALGNLERIAVANPVTALLYLQYPLRLLHIIGLSFVGSPASRTAFNFEKAIQSSGDAAGEVELEKGSYAAPKRILVTRAMGGIGDIMMMTAGLAALKKQFPNAEIDFAIPKSFHGLLDGFSAARLFDIKASRILLRGYDRWVNLTDCPAGRTESRQHPNVHSNRIEIFARAMGVSPRMLHQAGYTPVYKVTDEEARWAKDYIARINPDNLPIVGMQPFSVDTYKSWPYMEDLARRLSKDHLVLIFHHEDVSGFDALNIHKIIQPLRKSIALLAQCEKLAAVDSAFVHISAALGVKTTAIFGPTSGHVFCRHYKNVKYISPDKAEFPCNPCWRHEHKPCHITNGRESICMRSIQVGQVVAAMNNNTEQSTKKQSLWTRFKLWALYGGK